MSETPDLHTSNAVTEKREWVLRVLGVSIAEGGVNRPAEGSRKQREAIRQLIETVRSDLPALRRLNADAAGRLQDQFKAAIQAVEAGDLGTGLRLLLEVSGGIGAATAAARGGEARASIPEGVVGRAVARFEAARAKWASSRLRSIEGLDALTARLRESDDIDLHDIADRIEAISGALPDELEKALDGLIAAVGGGGAEAVAGAHKSVRSLADSVSGFLADYAEEIANCEDNPWKISVSIARPLSEALDGIENALSTL